MNKAVFRLLTATCVLFGVPALAQPPVAPGGTVYGNRTATQAQPGYTAVPVLGIPGSVLGRLGLAGNTSGTVTITPQAAAGTPTLTLPNASGTFAVSASSPLVLSATTGNLTCPTCLANSPAALTKTDDTNVTLTLGGSASTALLNAASIAAGWTGQLSLARGGTAANLTASNGGLVYSTASAFAILSGTATANQIPLSGSSAAPSWSTATYPGTAAAGTILAAGSANVIAGTATPTLGANGGTGGQVTLNGSTSGSSAVKVAAAAGTSTFQLPVGNGTNGFALTTNGSGVTSWSATGTGTVTSVTCNNGVTVITTSGTCASREMLSGNRIYYTRTNGDDTNCTGQTNSAYVSGSYPQNCAYLTIQKGVSQAFGALDLNSFNVTINVATGTYTGGISATAPQVGLGGIAVVGDTGTPSNVIISTTSANAVTVSNGATLTIDGFKLQTTSSGSSLQALYGGTVLVNRVDYGASAGDHITASNSATVKIQTSYTISGGASTHWHAGQNGTIQVGATTITLSGTPAFVAEFAGASTNGTIFVISGTFAGTGATGARYLSHSGAQIDTSNVSTSATYLPGDVGGVAYDGGYYNTLHDTAYSWTGYTPTITPVTGSFTTVSATASYWVSGRVTFITMNFTVTTAGGAAPNTVLLSLPSGVTPASTDYVFNAFDKNVGLSSGAAVGYMYNTTNIALSPNGGTWTNGHSYVLTGIFQNL